jgi:hypothetical protein
MRYNDVLNEEQLDELGIFKDIKAGFKGAMDNGVQGAVSGFKASQSSRQGEEHSSKIVSNLKAEYMKTVGGGNKATYASLIDFLGSHGLQDLDGIADPTNTGTAQPATSADPANTATPPTTTATPSAPSGTPTTPAVDPKAQQANLKARLKTGQGMGTKTGTGFKQSRVGVPVQKLVGKNPDGSPKFATVREDVEGATTLNNSQIDTIIKTAVEKNYSAIVAAQRGRSLPSRGGSGVSLGRSQSTAAEPASQVATDNPFNNPGKLLAQWQEYLDNGGQVTRKLRKAIETLNSALPQKAVAQQAAPVAPPQPGVTEGVGYSRFLGIQL